MQSQGRELSIPGFTAEASLYPTIGRTIGSRITPPAMHAVTPALSRFDCAITCGVCTWVFGGVRSSACEDCRYCEKLYTRNVIERPIDLRGFR
jgi:hypothetical protein